jgi:aspartyl-tRNA(Asn)/glutamyl-tRNA(Gln) amidotransferase subunit A
MELNELSIQSANELLVKREISSTELTKACLDRIEEIDGDLKAFVSVTNEKALMQALMVDEQKSFENEALAGIPMQLKDLICTKGVKTTCSSRMLEDFIPPYNATVTDRLFERGAILLGKGNMDEFAMGSSTENSAFFTTRNPWNLECVPGGSSGGSAAAVSAREAFYSLGSDTGGSIRQPASLCGVVALKPTYGLVSRYGLIAFASSLDQIGPLTRDVKDAAIVMNGIAGYDPKDSTSINLISPDYTAGLEKGLQGLKFGVPKEYFAEGTEPGVRKALDAAIKVLEELGADLEECSLPSTKYALACYYIIAPSECSANLARYDGVKYGHSQRLAENMWESMELTRKEGFGPEVKRRIMLGTYALSSGYYDAYYLKAQRVRTIIRSEMNDAFQKYDALITPTSPTIAFNVGAKTADPIQMYLSDICTIPANISGIPSMSVPCGFDSGLPIGMQIMGPVLSEAKLLNIAFSYEQATDWHKIGPSL